MTDQQYIDRTLKAMSRNGWEFSYCHSGNLYFPSAIEASYTNHEAGKLLQIDMPEAISWIFDPQAEHDPYGVFPEATITEIVGTIFCLTKPEERFKMFCTMLDKYGVR